MGLPRSGGRLVKFEESEKVRLARKWLLVPKSDGKHKERKIAEITKAGLDKDREQALEGAGEYILKIIAWDSAAPRHETLIERRFRVHPRD